MGLICCGNFKKKEDHPKRNFNSPTPKYFDSRPQPNYKPFCGESGVPSNNKAPDTFGNNKINGDHKQNGDSNDHIDGSIGDKQNGGYNDNKDDSHKRAFNIEDNKIQDNKTTNAGVYDFGNDAIVGKCYVTNICNYGEATDGNCKEETP